MTRPPLSFRPGKSAGFTLVEIAIAIGILAVALVALMGMLPAGLSNFRKAMDTSITAQIAQRILLDMQQADFDKVIDTQTSDKQDLSNLANFTFTAPTRGSQEFRFFDAQGNELITADGKTLTASQKPLLIYQVLTRIMPLAPQPANPTASGIVSLVTIQVARNPANRTLPVYTQGASNPAISYRNLFDPNSAAVKGSQIFTYSALLGKNQG